MLSGPVVGMVWEGLDAVKTGRKMLGATNPLASEPGELMTRPREDELTMQEPSEVTTLSRSEWSVPLTMPALGRDADRITERLPRIRLRRERPEGDRSLVPRVSFSYPPSSRRLN